MASLLDYPAMLFRELFVPRKAQTFTVAEIGWTLTLPKKFHLLSSKQIARLSKKGERDFDEIIEKRRSSPCRKILFVARYEISNRMIVSVTNFDDLSEIDWKRQNDEAYNNALKIAHFTSEDYKHVNITIETGARQKGNVVFNTLDVIASIPNRQLYRNRHYSTVYKNYGIHIIMSFVDEKIGEDMLDILRTSTFAN